MAELIWSFDELARYTKYEDPEVRYWAIDRLIRHFPDECSDTVQAFVLDDHEATPSMVARHLGEHGGAKHYSVLLRGFRLLRGLTPAYCLQALARLGYPNTVDLAASALHRGDLTEPALGMIVEALAELGSPDARELVREFL